MILLLSIAFVKFGSSIVSFRGWGSEVCNFKFHDHHGVYGLMLARMHTVCLCVPVASVSPYATRMPGDVDKEEDGAGVGIGADEVIAAGRVVRAECAMFVVVASIVCLAFVVVSVFVLAPANVMCADMAASCAI